MNETIANVFRAMCDAAPVSDVAILPDDGAHRVFRVTAGDARYILERARRSVIYAPEQETRNAELLSAHVDTIPEGRIRLTFPETRLYAETQGLWRLYRMPTVTSKTPEALGMALGAWHAAFDAFDSSRITPTCDSPLDVAAAFERLLTLSTRDPSGRLEEIVPELDRLMGSKRDAIALTGDRLRALCLASSLAIPAILDGEFPWLPGEPAIDRVGEETVVAFDPASVIVGQVAFDFGAACLGMRSAEDLSAFSDAFLTRAAQLLTEAECASLAFAPRAVALFSAVRHCSDALDGRTRHGRDPLTECRRMLRLAELYAEQTETIREIVERGLKRYRSANGL